MKTMCIFISLLFLFACKEKIVTQETGTIYLNPDEAQTLVVSDYFDDIKVLSFNGILYNSVQNFVQDSDRYIANLEAISEGMLGNYLYAFDLKGDSLYPIGTRGRGPGEYLYIDKFMVNKDQTIGIFSNDKYLKYKINGEFISEQSIITRDSNSTKPFYIFKDSILAFELLTTSDFVMISDKIETALNKKLANKYNLNLYSLKANKLRHTYSPYKECIGLKLTNFSYLINDTACFFIDFDNCIYNVFQDTIFPRYYLNRGKYDAWTTAAEYRAESRYKGIGEITFGETDRYVIGQYIKARYIHYYFIYDKALNKTYNFNAVDDDLLGTGNTKSKIFPSSNFREWITGFQFDNDYLYFSFRPHDLKKIIDKIKDKMDTSEWETYQQKYPDLIKAYEKINDESSDPIIIGYHFK